MAEWFSLLAIVAVVIVLREVAVSVSRMAAKVDVISNRLAAIQSALPEREDD